MSVTRTTLLQTASLFIANYNKWTVSSLLSLRSPVCIHRTGPASSAAPARNNSEFAAFVTPILPVFRNFTLTVIDEEETVIDVEKRKVVLHLRSRADTKVGLYQNEYYFTLTMSEDGKLVDEIVEFLDSGYTAEFVRRLQGVE